MPVAAMNTEFTLTQKRALAVATAIAIAFGAYFLRGYFILVVVAAVGGLPVHPSVQPAQQALRHRDVGDADAAGSDRCGGGADGLVRVPRRHSDHQHG